MQVILEISTIGRIEIEMFWERAPKNTFNFTKLAELGLYKGTKLFRVEKEFIAQGGDPLNTGKGGKENIHYYLQDGGVIPTTENIERCREGMVGMMITKKGIIGSQFFIALSDLPQVKFPIIGRVGNWDDLKSSFREIKVNIENIPAVDLVITNVIINDDHFPKVEPKIYPDLISELKAEKVEVYDSRKQEIINKAWDKGIVLDVAKTLETTTLWVGNLNPESKPVELEELFKKRFSCKRCTVKKNYLFLDFENIGDCDKAFKELKRTLIDDYRLKVDYHFKELSQSNKRPKLS